MNYAHCPLDATILAKVPIGNRIPWTQIASIDQYKQCINAIKQVTDGWSLARWECEFWNQA